MENNIPGIPLMPDAIGSLSNSQSYVPPASSSSGTSGFASTGSGLVRTSVDLSADAGVIATLGVPGVAVQTYDAAGLLNMISEAGSAPADSLPVPPSGSNTQLLSQQTLDQSVIGTLPADPSLSGIYSSSGSLQSLSANLTSNWASALQSNPALAKTVIADSYDQGIIGSISVQA